MIAGCALVVACLNVLFRDVEHILSAALLPWFFLTPILWGTGALTPTSASHHHLLVDVAALGELRRSADRGGARRGLARATCRGSATSSTSPSPLSPRSRSAPSCSSGSTIGSRSSSSAAAAPAGLARFGVHRSTTAVVGPRLVGGRGERRQAGDVGEALERDPLEDGRAEQRMGEVRDPAGAGLVGRERARPAPPERAAPSRSRPRPRRSPPRAPPRPARRSPAQARRTAAARGAGFPCARRPRPRSRSVSLPSSREPRPVLGDEVEREAVAARWDRRPHARLDVPRSPGGDERAARVRSPSQTIGLPRSSSQW